MLICRGAVDSISNSTASKLYINYLISQTQSSARYDHFFILQSDHARIIRIIIRTTFLIPVMSLYFASFGLVQWNAW